MRSRALLSAAALILGGFASAQSGPQELETGKPAEIIYPPPKILEVKESGNRVTVRFRELGLERVVGYRLYVLFAGKWRLVGTIAHSPAEAKNCKKQDAQYALAAVDESKVEGERRTFTSALTCAPGRDR
jgi:hypothetical protein